MNVASEVRHIKLRGGGYAAIQKWLVNHYGNADTPEDAACLLAIALFEQGVYREQQEDEKL